MLLYIVLAILLFGLLLVAHETGHFLAAKSVGIRVNEFSIFLGPAIWQRTKGETTYSLRCIPFGAYCAMEGENGDSDDPRSFTAAKPLHRLLVLIAGSAANFLLGFLILVLLYSFQAGIATPRISGFYEGSTVPQETGLQIGDTLHSIDGERVYLYNDVAILLSRNPTGVYDLTVRRDGALVALDDVPLTLREYTVNGETVTKYGVVFSVDKTTAPRVIAAAWHNALDFARLVRLSLQDLIHGLVGVGDLSGPIGIVSAMAQSGTAAKTTSGGVMNVAYFASFLAVNLAVMNMLPLPALDGGRVFFLLVTWAAETVLRRKIDPKYESFIHAAGLLLLLAFLAFITLKDILRLIG
ncbi:MAG: site-2 protease family protein [Oscillospiraceae bacterium]|nr:site-2 protease family protein [Oscillospiraceae bacterium]